ncbi:TonB-dependent receptor domain-containing protein [Candidatus Nitrospira bockiana]
MRGNNLLEPEKIVSYELGYQGWYLRHRLRLRADLFFNHIEELIKSAGARFSNDPGFAEIYGGEASVEVLITSWLTGFANYSYQEISQTFTDDARRGAPQYKANAGLRADLPNGLNGEAWIHHYGAATYPITSAFSDFSGPPFNVVVPASRVGSYTLLNLRIGYLFWNDKAEVAFSAFNALNDRHKEHPLGDTIGSRVMGWLTLRL